MRSPISTFFSLRVNFDILLRGISRPSNSIRIIQCLFHCCLGGRYATRNFLGILSEGFRVGESYLRAKVVAMPAHLQEWKANRFRLLEQKQVFTEVSLRSISAFRLQIISLQIDGCRAIEAWSEEHGGMNGVARWLGSSLVVRSPESRRIRSIRRILRTRWQRGMTKTTPFQSSPFSKSLIVPYVHIVPSFPGGLYAAV